MTASFGGGGGRSRLLPSSEIGSLIPALARLGRKRFVLLPRQNEVIPGVAQVVAEQRLIPSPGGVARADQMAIDEATEPNDLLESLVGHPLAVAPVAFFNRPQ